jgi:hypothetical protein
LAVLRLHSRPSPRGGGRLGVVLKCGPGRVRRGGTWQTEPG